uniref:GC-rich sequence DNA-binding factor 2-like n=1 Tax=Cynoglossus semilaevis TaxID=244447 RepID=A0A3P8W070_CYNSE
MFISLVEVTVQSEEEDEQLPHHSTPSAEEVVFSDVHEDFSDVRRILSRFEVWRGSYTESYNTLLGWNPLQNSSSELENLQWFTAVETFCYGHGHEQLENIDRKTLSNIIENTVLPKMTVFVELVWDPLSQQQSTCLSDLCHRLKEDYHIFEGELSKQGQALTEAVIQRLKSCVDEELFFPLFPQKYKDSTCRQQQFRQKQTWTAIKLLANMGKWDTLLPVTSLKELILDKVLNQYLVIALTTGTLTSPFLACKKIADSLPVSWFTGVTTCLPELQNFKNYLLHTADKLTSQFQFVNSLFLFFCRSAVVELLQVLSRIRCYESIRTIAEKYHFEDVLYSQQLLNQDLV